MYGGLICGFLCDPSGPNEMQGPGATVGGPFLGVNLPHEKTDKNRGGGGGVILGSEYFPNIFPV